MAIKPIVISFKEKEEWISDYAREHNSPAAWIKDLIVQDYKKNKQNVSGNQFQQASNVGGLFD